MREPLGRTASELLGAQDPSGLLARRSWATGFDMLDLLLGGGLHAGELVLLGGAQGLGKTTLALQMARSMARAGRPVTYLCYEHTDDEILARLLLMEAGLARPYDPPLPRTAVQHRREDDAVRERLDAAIEAVEAYGARFRVVSGVRSGARGGVVRLEEAVVDGAVLFVDYLQKVPSLVPEASEDERVTDIVERLKDHALRAGVPVVALVASDKAGLSSMRTRLHDLRGSTALAYESDVALILNEKQRIVARHHLVYGAPDTARYQDFLVCSVEKNRTGTAMVDLQLRKRFAHGSFDPEDSLVTEQLVDERVFRD
jgi:replicative DNA helicase